MPKLFTYGTLQLPAVQQETFGRLLEGEADELVGYRLEQVAIRDPRVAELSGEDIHPMVVFTDDSDDRVAGSWFELTDEELAAADEYEVDDYVRLATVLASGTMAFVYASRDR